MKDDALEDYRYEVLAYRIRGGEKPPEVPPILKEPKPKKDEAQKKRTSLNIGKRVPPPRPP